MPAALQEFVTGLKAPAEAGSEETSLARGKVAQPYLIIPQELPELKNKEFAESTPSYGGYGGRGGGYGGRGGAGSSRGGFPALSGQVAALTKQAAAKRAPELGLSSHSSLVSSSQGLAAPLSTTKLLAQMHLNMAASWTPVSWQLSGLCVSRPRAAAASVRHLE